MLDAKLEQALVALQPRLRRFAYGLSGSMDEADELVQCTYERALVRIEQWQPGTRLDSWLYRILQSIRLNKLRADRVRGKQFEPVDPDTQGCEKAGHQLEASMMLESVRRFIWRLSEEQRAPLLLVAVEGMSYKEASEVLDIPMGTLTSRLGRARLALVAMLDADPSKQQREVG